MELEDEEGLCPLEERQCVIEEQTYKGLSTEDVQLSEDLQIIEEDILPIEEQPVPVKKKRGKKRKLVYEVFLPLPEEALTGYSTDIIEELQAAYKILQIIMGISMIKPFLDRPNENLFGMSSYYNIIKKPMWLNEVQRKLLSREYNGIADFVADIRLILENCYRFWGPTHKFSRKALFIEHKLENKLSSLPESMQEKCLESETNANEVIVKTENTNDGYEDNNDEEKEQECVKNSVAVTLIKGFESKILNRVLESDDPYDTEDIEEQNRKEQEMLAWEREHLVSDADRDQIKAMWQLAEIGSFLKLTHEVLNVEEITQYEVERMLLMPKESTTLATLMTSMLSPQVLRAQLDFKAVMPYEIWTFRLKKRIDSWFHIFYASDEFQAFMECGVEPPFWSFINNTNPLDNSGFHEIPFLQRVWIFKSLCNNLMHTDKPIQDCFYNNNTKELRPICIGRDKRGSKYLRIPFFQEIRVYKQASLPEKTYKSVYEGDFHDDFLAELLEKTNEIDFDEYEQKIELTPSSKDCLMIADSVESLTAFTKQLKDRKQLGLARSFTNQLKLVKNDRKSIDGLIALHTQWHEYQNRSQEYFAHILTLWLTAEKDKQRHVDYMNAGNEDDKCEEVLGKRRSKRNENTDFLCYKGSDDSDAVQSSNCDSSDVSDWETTYRNKKKKKQDIKKKRRRASSESNVSEVEEVPCNEESNSSLSILGVQSINDDFFEVEEKPNINEISIKIENGNDIDTNPPMSSPQVSSTNASKNALGFVNSISPTSKLLSTSTASVKLTSVTSLASSVCTIPPGDIKKEKDDVICISSDEEDDKKPLPILSSAGNILKNGIPTPKAGPPSSVPPHILTTPPRRNSIPQPIPIQPVPQPIPVHQPAKPVPQPIPVQAVPQPIPVPGMPQPIPATPPKKGGVPLPKPAPPVRRMPLPILEPSWPQPIVEPAMPQPMPAPRPQGWPSPRTPTTVVPPRTRMTSPRLRSPLSSPRTPSPRPSPLRAALSPTRPTVRNPAVRNLFPQPSGVHTVEGVLEIGQKPDGSYGYHVRLPDGGIINMNRQEIDEIRRKNNGVLPVKLEVPLTKNKKF